MIGIDDLVTGSSGANVNVWIGNGDGTFQPSCFYFAGTDPGHQAWLILTARQARHLGGGIQHTRHRHSAWATPMALLIRSVRRILCTNSKVIAVD